MLSIGKLTAGREAYYLSGLAATGDEYYLDPTEVPGRWAGALAAELEVSGLVTPEAFRAALAGRHPASGGALVANAGQADRVTGFDLTFSSPKSVSVLWALGDPAVSDAVADAHDRAVVAALDALESEATFARRGHAGVHQVPGDGVVAVGFGHRTSRAGDPHLHTHLVVANLTRGGDGRWSSLDGRPIYGWAKTVGYLYQAELRARLAETLGVTWGPVRNGTADIASVSADQLRGFSHRRAEITAELDRLGAHSARAAQTATLATRAAKTHHIDLDALRQGWAAQAADIGVDVDTLTGPARTPPAAAESLDEELLGPTGLTAQASSFDRRHILQAYAGAHPDGATVLQLRARTDRLLARSEVRSLDANLPTSGPRFTTAELLATEARMVTVAAHRIDDHLGHVDTSNVAEVLAERSGLSDEQSAMVTRLVTSGAGVEVVIGKAGAGKTFALDAARSVWAAAGYHVIGAALAARAAAELQAGAGIPSTTVDRLLVDLDRSGPLAGFAPRSVLVVDEAGMVGTRKLDRLLAHAAQARSKVVLVGDPRQLPEIDAGGALAALARHLEPIRLVDNRRQTQVWERAALDQLRAGSVARAVTAYAEHGRITVAPSAEDARRRLVHDWHAARHDGELVAMYALRRDDVADLNAAARSRLRADGTLTGPDQHIAGRDFAVGDQILCLRNDRRLGVTNGTTGTLTAVDDQHATIGFGDGRSLALPGWYLHAGHLTHGYATTIHKSQGATVERAFVLGSDQLYREAGYVGLSRARAGTDLYLVGAAHDRQVGADPISDLVATLGISRAQALALDQHLTPAAEVNPAIRFEEQAGVHDRLRAEILHRLPAGAERGRWIADHTDLVERYRRSARALSHARADLGAGALADPPLWLVDTIGAPPHRHTDRDRWEHTAATLIAYRHTYRITDTDITDRDRPLGPEPDDLRQRRHWSQAQLALTATRQRNLEPELELEP